MRQTEYLKGVLEYYANYDIVPGDPNEGQWENAHTPYPRAMGESTVLLLHEHHVIHDLWQSKELGECHFFPPDAKKVLERANFFPTGWFELCDIQETLALGHQRTAGRKGGAIGGKIAVVQTDRICREKGIGIYSKATQQKGGESCFEQGKGIFAPENLGKGARNTNAQIWECLKTGRRLPPGPLTKYQRSKGIDTKQRKRLSLRSYSSSIIRHYFTGVGMLF